MGVRFRLSNRTRIKRCHQSSIPPPSSRSTSELLVAKSVPLPRSPQRLVLSVSHPRRSVTISARPPPTGRVSRSPSSWRFRTDRHRSLLSHPPLPSSSRPSGNPSETERRSRTSSTTVTLPWMTSSAAPELCDHDPVPATFPELSEKSSALLSPLDALLTVPTHTISSTRSRLANSMFLLNKY